MYRANSLEEAFILHARNYRDTSLILDLFTRESGRYSIVVKGARSAKSKIRGRLQPFTPILVSAVGRSELKTSTHIDFPEKSFALRGRSLMLGLYVNELLFRLLDRFYPIEGLYQGYKDMLEELVGSRKTALTPEHGSDVLAIRKFELCLLQQLGYGINFEYDARDGQKVLSHRHYLFQAQEGFHSINAPDAESFSGEEVLRISSGDLSSVDSKKLLDLTRRSLSELLGDKPLKSRSLFRSAH